jgi:hypothetical protein
MDPALSLLTDIFRIIQHIPAFFKLSPLQKMSTIVDAASQAIPTSVFPLPSAIGPLSTAFLPLV